jgi:hypothetical protein
MVVKRQWKIVSGGVAAAVTLGGGAALAHTSAGEPEVPLLQDVVNVTEIKIPQVLDTSTVLGATDDGVQEADGDSPFSALTASEESEPTVSEPSPESESEPSVSEPSPESESEPSADSESVPSPESDD